MELTELCFAGICRQIEALRAGQVSARELVGGYLARIERWDGGLGAYRVVFAEQALAAAEQADQRRARGVAAPLLGVPIAVKEDLAIAGLPTTLGTDAVSRIASDDAAVVARLRAAGAVLVGRTRAPELCLWPYTETEFGGVTRNPWAREFSSAGSSGGSATAVSAGLAAAALGTDGGGSIRLPAAATGLFGLKPQRDRVSVAGPITHTVADAGLLTDVLAGTSEFAAAAAREPGRLRVAVSFRSWPIGVRVDPQVRAAVWATAELLAGLGHRVVVAHPRFPDPADLYGFAPRYLRGAADEVARELDAPARLSRRSRQVAALGRVCGDRVVGASRRLGGRIASAVDEFFADFDVVLSPVTGGLPLRVGQWAGHSTLRVLLAAQQYVGYTAIWNVTGHPAVSLPAGFAAEGVPLAVQLVGRARGEATLLALSAQLEAARPWAAATPPGL